MSSWRDRLAGLVLGAAALGAVAAEMPGIGRAATPQEIAAWDIDVRPDFKGLPPGQGSVRDGQKVWEAQCASCHGVFGESNQVFNPLVGGTDAADIAGGRTARLKDKAFPARTTLMKLPTVSTLWDYIRRAMPWNAPKTLTTNEVYAVTAYLLHLGEIVAEDFVLTERTMAQAQARLPNRAGMTTRHALWPGAEPGGAAKPDVQGSRCMRDCAPEPKIASLLPDHARDQHGNLAEQNRLVGPQRGVDTRRAKTAVAAAATEPAPMLALLQKQGCVACHGVERALVGPAFRDIATKQGSRDDAVAYLAGRIKAGGSGSWGTLPMPPQPLGEEDALTIARWLASGARP